MCTPTILSKKVPTKAAEPLRSMPGEDSRNPIASEDRQHPKIQRGDIVTLDWELEAENFVPESLFDRQGRITLVVGGGHYLPGLHELLLLSGSQQSSESVVSMDAGWGARQDNLLFRVPRTRMPKLLGEAAAAALAVGQTVHLQGKVPVLVSEIVDDNSNNNNNSNEQIVVLDANPPMAGASYACRYSIVQVHPGLSPQQFGYTADTPAIEPRFQVATLALGCFWGAELAGMRCPGVVGTEVGYTQGTTAHPTYQQVCTGKTRHREAVRIVFDSTVVSYREVLETVALERLADTTSTIEVAQNRLLYEEEEDDDDEDDENVQYKNGIYYHNEAQRMVAEEVLQRDGRFVRQVEQKRASDFYLAEDYHQQYLYKGGQSARKGEKEPIRCFG